MQSKVETTTKSQAKLGVTDCCDFSPLLPKTAPQHHSKHSGRLGRLCFCSAMSSFEHVLFGDPICWFVGVARDAGRPRVWAIPVESREAHACVVPVPLEFSLSTRPSVHRGDQSNSMPILSARGSFFCCTLLHLPPLILFLFLPRPVPFTVPQDICCAPLVLASRTGPAPLRSINSIK